MEEASGYVVNRFVMLEKFNNSFTIKIVPADLIDENLVWYYKHKNEHFKVRKPSLFEIKSVEFTSGFNKEYIERLVKQGFYVVFDETFFRGCWIGKCDTRIVKSL